MFLAGTSIQLAVILMYCIWELLIQSPPVMLMIKEVFGSLIQNGIQMSNTTSNL